MYPHAAITARGLAADPTGQYLYMVGVSAESVDFDGYSFTNVGSGANMYLVKMSTADGTVQWAQQYAASSGTVTDTFAAAANFISIDSAGDVYLAGFYTVRNVCLLTGDMGISQYPETNSFNLQPSASSAEYL